MAVVGAGVLPSTFMAAKSVCVSSLLAGPRSFVFGGPIGPLLEARAAVVVAWNCLHSRGFGCRGATREAVLRECCVVLARTQALASLMMLAMSKRDEFAIDVASWL